MGGSYTADEQAAAKLAGAIADSPSQLKAGSVTKTTSATTAVVTHGLTGTPDFILFSVRGATAILNSTLATANTTAITFTNATATGTWTVDYISGVTA